ncbi:ABC transporter permease [Clostridium sp. D2Q-14]|uniref:ABC transporter permease n=1 Tax=Anaeromonas gelatinilytica TaxID=2683194 RepID=UPI00193BFD2E|nr:ABC transporter permease [Anaeromonas gelatinilytica]MBS4536515.1 ABC transporter permease [Anaeromonas gelatinilytica]
MSSLKKAIQDFKKYKEYILFTTKSELKVQLSSTFLGYLWWILDPLMYMLVYMLVVMIIFKSGGENFPIFVFSALVPWKWTVSSIKDAAKSIKGKSSILQQVYLPKYILPLIKTLINTTKFLFGILVLLVLLIFFRVPYTVHLMEFFVVFMVQLSLILGIGFILAHLGVFFKDIDNILDFTLRFWFYVSPTLYGLEKIPEKVRFIWWLNPLTTIYTSYRNIFLEGTSPLYGPLLIWFAFSVVLISIGLKYLYKFDKNYTKVI